MHIEQFRRDAAQGRDARAVLVIQPASSSVSQPAQGSRTLARGSSIVMRTLAPLML
jgi:hypothetical protein